MLAGACSIQAEVRTMQEGHVFVRQPQVASRLKLSHRELHKQDGEGK